MKADLLAGVECPGEVADVPPVRADLVAWAMAAPMAWIDSVAAWNTPHTPLATDSTRMAWKSSPMSVVVNC